MEILFLQTSYIPPSSHNFTKGNDPEIIWEYLYEYFSIEIMLLVNESKSKK